MQYITQCLHYSRLITRRFREDNYLLSQIVKEQPIHASEEAPSKRARAIGCCFLEVMLVEPTGI